MRLVGSGQRIETTATTADFEHRVATDERDIVPVDPHFRGRLEAQCPCPPSVPPHLTAGGQGPLGTLFVRVRNQSTNFSLHDRHIIMAHDRMNTGQEAGLLRWRLANRAAQDIYITYCPSGASDGYLSLKG